MGDERHEKIQKRAYHSVKAAAIPSIIGTAPRPRSTGKRLCR
ncbi:hypothetical protein ACVILI_005101 [Mesorhizobium sp. USDA 4775]